MTGDFALRAATITALAALVGATLGFAARESGALAFAFGLLAAIVFFGIALAANWQTRRAIVEVTRAAGRMQANDFTSIEPVAGPADELTTRFNQMIRQLERALQGSRDEHDRLERILGASNDAILVLDDETHLMFANPAAEQLLQAPMERMRGRPMIESVRDHEIDQLVRRAAQDGADAERVISYGPGRTPLRATAKRIPGDGDWSILLVLSDLTEVNRLDAARRDFISNVSHELRTPLASIRALAETLEDAGAEPEEVGQFASRIVFQVDRLTVLVNELLDLSRLESGAVKLEPERLDLAVLAAEAANVVRPRAERAGVALHLPPLPGPEAEVDRTAMLRVVSNLLDNAVKFSPSGSSVDVTLGEEAGSTTITVRDHGPGIAPSDLPRVFERFYKGDTSRSGTGVGLGLAIVKHAVRAHSGTVEVVSTPGEGAAFTVTLPRVFTGSRNGAGR